MRRRLEWRLAIDQDETLAKAACACLEALGATLLGLTVDEHYALLCWAADSLLA
jgi:hypothetical protein